ncbi:hypothetical protein [Nocardia brasiliensis]|uniref:hypothetical protein n=1 Tax=Nocardia brasiliensis TaxID=37326 RepID=UPI002454C184|nr:hypothetical protein [Nocardia brasiliensis]
MNDAVRIHRTGDGLVVVAPAGAPPPLLGGPRLDVTVLEVLGGHLTWRLLDGGPLPAAVLDRADLAQEWLWAVFGEQIALAVEAGADVELPAAPELPELVLSAWRLGYAHWAVRWWPASVLDGIAPLDERLLFDEIAVLSAECEMLVDGADQAVEEVDLPVYVGRAEDYALAAGPAAAPSGALVLARGSTGWDWRCCPPGLLDASERAISWEVRRDGGRTIVSVRAVAAPGLPAEVPEHLHPHAAIHTSTGTIETALALHGDQWTAEVTAPDTADPAVRVVVSVPGVGDADYGSGVTSQSHPGSSGIESGGTTSNNAGQGESEPSGGLPNSGGTPENAASNARAERGSRSGDLGGAQIRQRIRDFAATRLRRATDPEAAPLAAETAAAASDSDF